MSIKVRRSFGSTGEHFSRLPLMSGYAQRRRMELSNPRHAKPFFGSLIFLRLQPKLDQGGRDVRRGVVGSFHFPFRGQGNFMPMSRQEQHFVGQQKGICVWSYALAMRGRRLNIGECFSKEQ